jgi:hypothetical protein
MVWEEEEAGGMALGEEEEERGAGGCLESSSFLSRSASPSSPSLFLLSLHSPSRAVSAGDRSPEVAVEEGTICPLPLLPPPDPSPSCVVTDSLRALLENSKWWENEGMKLDRREAGCEEGSSVFALFLGEEGVVRAEDDGRGGC